MNANGTRKRTPERNLRQKWEALAVEGVRAPVENSESHLRLGVPAADAGTKRQGLVQVEQQDLGLAITGQFDAGLLAYGGTVTCRKSVSVQFHVALGDMDPRVALRLQLNRNTFARVESGEPEINILVDAYAAVATGAAGDQV